MKTNHDAKNWYKLWSVRLAIAAAVLGAVEATLPLWQDVVPEGVFATVSSLVAVAAAVARIIRQEGLSHDK